MKEMPPLYAICQYPQELVSRLIKALTKVDDCVLDPFIGSGTTALASIELNRRYVGIEIAKEYQKLALSAIRNHQKKIEGGKNESYKRKIQSNLVF